MEKDKLEKYISEHRNDFDDQDVPEGLWGKINNDVNEPLRFRKVISVSWKIAAAVILFVASYFFNFYMNGNKQYSGQSAYTGKNVIYFKRTIVNVNQVVCPANNSENRHTSNSFAENIAKDKTVVDSASIEFEKLNAYYASRIEQKKKEIFIFTASNPKIEKDVTIEFEQLDSAYKALRNDLKDNVDNSEVVSAMIQNYRIRLEILENILEQLKKINDHEKKNKQYDI